MPYGMDWSSSRVALMQPVVPGGGAQQGACACPCREPNETM